MKILKSRMGIAIIAAVILLVAGFTTVVYAAIIHQQVSVNVTVDPADPPPATEFMYSDPGLTSPLTSIQAQYKQGGYYTLTVYVPAEVNSINPVFLANSPDIAISQTFGSVVGNAKELMITISGGYSTTHNYSGIADFSTGN